MEDYSLSSMKKPAAPLSSQGITTQDNSHEESGWTNYLQDFCKQSSELSQCSSLGTSSLLSDATSRYHGHDMAVTFPDMPSKNLIVIKKMRTEQMISEEESLEDTASSPVHHSPMGKLDNDYYHETTGKRSELLFIGPDYEFTSLKKRRLCLVPLSLLSNLVG